MEQRTMLIVDDIEVNRTALAECFRNDFRILEAAGGREAIDLIGKNADSIAIILLDIVMPDMGGIEVLKWLHSSPYRSIPIIAVTAEPGFQLKALENGAWDFIPKSTDNQIIRARVRNVLGRQALEDEQKHSGLLAKSKLEMDHLLNSIPGGIAIYKIGQKVETLYYNDGVCALSGNTRESYDKWLSGGDALVTVYRDDIPRLMDEIKAAIAEKRPISINYRLKHKEGGTVWVQLKAIQISEEDACPVFYAVFMGMTEETRLYHSIIQESPSSIYVCNATTYELLYLNNASCAVCGLDATQMNGRKCYEVFMHRDSPCPFCKISQMSDQDFYVRSFTQPESGNTYIMKGRRIDWNGIDAHIEYVIDDTERTNAHREIQRQLREQECLAACNRHLSGTPDFYTSIQSILCEMGQYYSAERCILLEIDRVTGTASKLNRWTRQPLADNPDSVRFPLNAYETLIHRLEEKTAHTVRDITALKNRDPRLYNFLSQLGITNLRSVCCDVDDTHQAFIGVFNSDLCDPDCSLLEQVTFFIRHAMNRYYMDRELQHTTEQLHDVLGSIPGALSVVDPARFPSGTLFLSDGWERLTGYPAELHLGIMGNEQNPMVEPQEAVRAHDAMREAFCNKTDIDITLRMRHLDGHALWLRYKATPIMREQSLLYYGFYLDVTKEMQAQAQVRRSQDTLAAAMDHAALYFWEYDMKTRTAYQQSKTIRNYQVPPVMENYPQSLIDLGRVHPDSIADYLAMHKALEDGAEFVERDIHMLPPEGGSVWDKVKYTVIFDEDHHPVKAIGTAENIDAYKELEETFTLAAQQSNLVVWRYDITAGSVICWQNTMDAYGYGGIIQNVPESLFANGSVHPEDIPLVRQMYDEVNSGAKTSGCTARWKRPQSDEWWWAKITYTTIFDKDGKPIRAIGSSVDVTEEKLAQQRYLEEADYRQSLGNGLIASHRVNLTRGIIEESHSEIHKVPFRENSPIDDSIFHAVCESAIPNEAQRKAYYEAFNPQKLLKDYRDGITALEKEYRAEFNDGSRRWVVVRVKLIKKPATGDIMAFFNTWDINDKKVAQEMINTVVNMDYDYLALLNMQQDDYTIYRKAENGSPLPPFHSSNYESEVAEYAKEFLVPEDAERNIREMSYENLREKLAEQEIYTTYCAIMEPDGRISHKKLQYSYLDRAEQKVILTRTDVTDVFQNEQKKNEALVTALTAAKQANTAKSDFLSRMSHEIRTPMNAIIGMTTIAAQSIGNDDQVADCLSKIGISSRFLLSLINDILDMSRIESGKVLLKKEKIPFEEFINGVNAICCSQAQNKDIDYECVVDHNAEDYYIGDAMKLQQIIINIVSNSIKFTPQGGKVSLRILQLKRMKNNAILRFVINDTGCGISDEFLPRLFEPFSQEHSGTTTMYGGTGLGLSICKNLVELMDGTIKVRSIVDVGSEFTVDLKLGIPEDAKSRPGKSFRSTLPA